MQPLPLRPSLFFHASPTRTIDVYILLHGARQKLFVILIRVSNPRYRYHRRSKWAHPISTLNLRDFGDLQPSFHHIWCTLCAHHQSVATMDGGAADFADPPTNTVLEAQVTEEGIPAPATGEFIAFPSGEIAMLFLKKHPRRRCQSCHDFCIARKASRLYPSPSVR